MRTGRHIYIFNKLELCLGSIFFTHAAACRVNTYTRLKAQSHQLRSCGNDVNVQVKAEVIIVSRHILKRHRISATTCRYLIEYKRVIQNLGQEKSGDGGGVEEACKCDEVLEHEVVEGLKDDTGQRNASEQVVAAAGVLHRVSPSPSLPSSSSSTPGKPTSTPSSPSSMKSCVERRQGADRMCSDERAERRERTPHCRCQQSCAPRNDVIAMRDKTA
jgi:hypothetical protein